MSNIELKNAGLKITLPRVKILSKLENQETNLDESIGDYQRLILLNKHVDELFKKKFKEISDKKIND